MRLPQTAGREGADCHSGLTLLRRLNIVWIDSSGKANKILKTFLRLYYLKAGCLWQIGKLFLVTVELRSDRIPRRTNLWHLIGRWERCLIWLML